jgi:hypothetical protein
LSEYNSNLASGEFGNYFERLSRMAGMGSAATNQNQQAGQTAANNISNGLMAQGDARASGIMGQANSWSNAIGSGINSYLQYGGRTPYSVPADIQNFQYGQQYNDPNNYSFGR